jgi:hypothetical protein
MTQALYAHMNNKKLKLKKEKRETLTEIGKEWQKQHCVIFPQLKQSLPNSQKAQKLLCNTSLI